jgi:hypothetical protein
MISIVSISPPKIKKNKLVDFFIWLICASKETLKSFWASSNRIKFVWYKFNESKFSAVYSIDEPFIYILRKVLILNRKFYWLTKFGVLLMPIRKISSILVKSSKSSKFSKSRKLWKSYESVE